MKKIHKLLFVIISLFIFENKVNASAISLRSSSSTVNRGNSVTVTATISAGSGIYTASGSVYCSGAGVGNGLDLTYEDLNTSSKSLSRSVKLSPSSSGTITCKTQNVKIRELAKDEEYKLSDTSITITVTNNNSSGGTGTSNETAEDIKEKSSDNTLSDLSVDGYDIEPKFNKDTLEYKLTVDEKVEKINVKAKTNDSKAEVKGIGEVNLSAGDNTIEIKVIAENGNEKVYKIIVTVEDQNPIEVTVGKKKYTIVKKNNNLLDKLDYYEETTIKINDEDVVAYKNTKTNVTLVILKDSNNKLGYFVYDEKANTYTKYEFITVGNVTLQLLNPTEQLDNYKNYKEKIKGQDVNIYKINKSEKFGLIYGTNVVTGNKGYYLYDKDEETLSRYYDGEVNLYKDKIDKYVQSAIIAGGILSGVLIIVLTISLIRSGKKQRKINH